jgi:enamine deaminase RidA (YjgF/YER057c/UK114 family)
MITRTNPDVGYLDQEVFEALGFTQVIRADNTVYLSGIAPLTGKPDGLQIVGSGDLAEQVTFVLDVLERCLASEGLTFEHMVAVTVYVTDIDALVAEAPLFTKRYGAHTPTSTWVEIAKLVHPEQQIEITAIAVGPPA